MIKKLNAEKKNQPCRSYFAPGRLRFLMLEKGEKGKLKLASSGCKSKDSKSLHSPSQKQVAKDISF